MSYNDFWHNDAELYWAYQVAYVNKLKELNEFENNVSWLRGLYMYQAFSTVEYNINKRPSDPPQNYLEKPIDFEEARRSQEKDVRQNMLEAKMRALLESKKIVLDKRKKEK